MATETKKRRTTEPPDGYVCSLCQVPGHWIQQCSLRKKKRRKKSNHVPIPGVDPSQQDIDLARQYQKIKPPNCFCGQPSRLKKVKKSHVNENSRAIGKYFFFCALKKNEGPCRFARLVDDELKDKKERLCSFFVKNGSCKKGDKCMFRHELPENTLQNSHAKHRTAKDEEQAIDETEQQEIIVQANNKEEDSAKESTSSSDSSDSSDSDDSDLNDSDASDSSSDESDSGESSSSDSSSSNEE